LDLENYNFFSIGDTDEDEEYVNNINDRTLTMDSVGGNIIDLSTSEQEVEPMMVDPPSSHLFPK